MQELAIKDDESFAVAPRHATKESDLPNSLSERNSTERSPPQLGRRWCEFLSVLTVHDECSGPAPVEFAHPQFHLRKVFVVWIDRREFQ